MPGPEHNPAEPLSPRRVVERRISLQSTWPTLKTLLLGALGGAAFFWIGLPAPWISGAMVAVAAAALLGLDVGMVLWLRQIAFVGLGFSMGTGITPATFDRVALWPLSLLVLALSVLTSTLLLKAYLERVHRWDPVTSSLSAVPGAFAYVMILATRTAADVPRIAVTQIMRLVALTAVLPPLLALPGAGQVKLAGVPTSLGQWPELVLCLAAAGLLGILFERLRVPAGIMLGAMIASASIHGAGLSEARLPPAILVPGFIITGAFVGARIRGLSISLILHTMGAGLAMVLLAVMSSGAFALLAATLLDLPFGLLWLAYAPGGVEVMAILALALDLDPAFVGAHHAVRFIALSLIMPLWLRRHLR